MEKRKALSIASFPVIASSSPPSLRQSYLFNIWRRGEARKDEGNEEE
jgi:hypothetical protein